MNRSNVNCKDRYRNIINILNKANLIADCQSEDLNLNEKKINENTKIIGEGNDFNCLRDISESFSSNYEKRSESKHLHASKNVSACYNQLNLTKSKSKSKSKSKTKSNSLIQLNCNSDLKLSSTKFTARKAWSFAETVLLVQLHKEGLNWTQIAFKLHSRSNSNCSDRWKTLIRKYSDSTNIYCKFIE